MSQVWLITASSHGFGRALAEAVLAGGHKLVATARHPAPLGGLVERYSDQVRAVALDVTNARAAGHAIKAAVDAFGRLDVLVNNAGDGDVGSIEDTSDADFRAQIETNLFGIINVTRAAIPLLREQRSGHIIQFSSIGGRRETPAVGGDHLSACAEGGNMDPVEARRRLAIAEASDQLWNGAITRAAFLRVCASAGIGLVGFGLARPRRATAAAPTTHQIRATAGPNSAIEPTSDQHKFLRDVGRTFAGQTVHVVTEDTPPSLATRGIMQQEFMPLTGIHVVWELLPLDRVLAKVSADTARQVGATDIFYLDQAWVGRFANDTVPVKELLAKQELAYPNYAFDDILPALVEHVASYNGQVAGIPYDIPIHIILYRRDIFERLRLSPPKTVPDYLATVRAIHRAMHPHVYGTTAMWKPGHYALLIDAATWLWAHGGSFFGPHDRPAINDDRTVAGMEFMQALGTYVPPEAITWDWSGAAKSFVEGRAGLSINAGEWFSMCDDPAQSRVVGLVDAAPCPAELAIRPASQCSFGETPGLSRQGGSYLGLSKYGKRPDAAWILMQWATSADITTRASLLGGGASPVRQSNFDDPRIKAKATVGIGTTRHFGVTLDAINNRMGTEPHLPAWPSLAVDRFAVELGKMITGQQSIRATLDHMATQAEQAVLRDARSVK